MEEESVSNSHKKAWHPALTIPEICTECRRIFWEYHKKLNVSSPYYSFLGICCEPLSKTDYWARWSCGISKICHKYSTGDPGTPHTSSSPLFHVNVSKGIIHFYLQEFKTELLPLYWLSYQGIAVTSSREQGISSTHCNIDWHSEAANDDISGTAKHVILSMLEFTES